MSKKSINWMAVLMGLSLLVSGIGHLWLGDHVWRGFTVKGAIGWVLIAGGVPMLVEQIYRACKGKKPPEERPS